MMNILKAGLLLFVLVLLFGLQSCAEMKGWVSSESPVQTPAPAAPAPQAPGQIPAPVKPVPQTPDQSSAQARKHVEAGEYQKAINIYDDARRKQPQDVSLIEEYAECLDEIKSTADKLLETGALAAAGRQYYVLQNNYTKFQDVGKMLSFDSAELNTKLDYCKKSLSRQGFEEYRKGNLNKAIVLWQGLLAIDPHNNDIKEAVRTATQQKRNLQEKN